MNETNKQCNVFEVYSKLKEWTIATYGTSNWIYVDFFRDPEGFTTFENELKHIINENSQTTTDDAICQIKEKLAKAMAWHKAEQAYVEACLFGI